MARLLLQIQFKIELHYCMMDIAITYLFSLCVLTVPYPPCYILVVLPSDTVLFGPICWMLLFLCLYRRIFIAAVIVAVVAGTAQCQSGEGFLA